MSLSAQARQAFVASLHREVARLEGGRPPQDERLLSTGAPALDRLLPGGGLRRGTLVEYLTPASGSGAGTLALSAAREACREGRAFVVLDRTTLAPSASEGSRLKHFYPPGTAVGGIDLEMMVVLRPASEADALWSLDQALRCPGVGAVWAPLDRVDARDFRRLQLAAERGGTLGLLLRPARLRGQPTWADVQWLVRTMSKIESPRSKIRRPSTFDLQPSTWKLRVELVRSRGGIGGQVVLVELDEATCIWREVPGHATRFVPVLAPVADSAPASRA
jgi:protein ImuA